MDVRPPPYPEYRTQWEKPTYEYRVVIWEQPVLEEGDPQDIDPEMIGWGEMTFDLVDVEDVHEAIDWATQQLAANRGPYSESGGPVPHAGPGEAARATPSFKPCAARRSSPS